MVLFLRALGGLSLEESGRPIRGAAAQRSRLAILAYLAVSADRPVSRDRLLALFWPESDTERARGALKQALYALRRDVSEQDLTVGTSEIRLNPDVIRSDVGEFMAALDAGDLERAITSYAGTFLDGIHLRFATEFERWVERERDRLRRRYHAALGELAAAAEGSGDFLRAAGWWHKLAAADPLSSTVAISLLKALVASGDAPAALRHARVHTLLVQQELETTPDPSISSLVQQIRASVAVREAEQDRAGHKASPGDVRQEPNRVAELQPAPAANAATPPPDKRGRRWGVWGRRARPILVTCGIVATGIAAPLWITTRDMLHGSASGVLADSIVAVMPFAVSGDSSAEYLREGIATLIAAKLTGAGGVRAAAPGLVLQAWRDGPGLLPHAEPGQDGLRAIARRVGAGQFVDGEVAAGADRLVIRARLMRASDGDLRDEISVEGPTDSLTSLLDHLVAQLLVGEADERGPRLAYLTSTSLPALKAYLNGQAAYRRGAYAKAVQNFRLAVATDSTFALANLGLGLALGWSGIPDDSRAAERAWAWRDRLSGPDRAFLAAFGFPFAGPRPTQSEYRAGWEHAVAAAPDRAEVWYHLGDMLFHREDFLGPESPDAAANALRRSLDLDSLFAPSIFHLFQLSAHNGDTAEVRRLGERYLHIDPSGELVPFVRWRMSAALGDSMQFREIAASINTMPWPSLRWLLMTSQFDGLAPEDAARALAARMRQAATSDERYEVLLLAHAFALNRGQSDDALEATRGIEALREATGEHLRFRVLDALYASGDSLAANAAAIELQSHVRSSRPRSVVERVRFNRDLCVLEQWRLHHGRTDDVATSIMTLSKSSVTPGSTEQTENVACRLLLDTWLATVTQRADRTRKLAQLDSLVEDGPGMEDLLSYLPLIRARLHNAQADVGGALHAVRRRFYMAYYPHYLASHLLEEGRDATLLGDWSGAVHAFQRYLTLRAHAGFTVQDALVLAEYGRVLRRSASAGSKIPQRQAALDSGDSRVRRP
jgi:DNA-binding SARP family transcriptional activator